MSPWYAVFIGFPAKAIASAFVANHARSDPLDRRQRFCEFIARSRFPSASGDLRRSTTIGFPFCRARTRGRSYCVSSDHIGRIGEILGASCGLARHNHLQKVRCRYQLFVALAATLLRFPRPAAPAADSRQKPIANNHLGRWDRDHISPSGPGCHRDAQSSAQGQGRCRSPKEIHGLFALLRVKLFSFSSEQARRCHGSPEVDRRVADYRREA
jgi:hypothetical protein